MQATSNHENSQWQDPGIIISLANRKARDPHKEYAPILEQLTGESKEIATLLQSSTIPADHLLWSRSREVDDKLLDLGLKDIVPPSTDSKDFYRRGDRDSTYKLPKINIPKFQGGLENWHSYWGRAVHDNDKLDNEAKMAHLIETITDPALSEYLTASNDGTGRYPEVIEYLKERFNQPRELHRIYCKTLADMQPIKGTQPELTQAADTVFAAVTGLI